MYIFRQSHRGSGPRLIESNELSASVKALHAQFTIVLSLRVHNWSEVARSALWTKLGRARISTVARTTKYNNLISSPQNASWLHRFSRGHDYTRYFFSKLFRVSYQVRPPKSGVDKPAWYQERLSTLIIVSCCKLRESRDSHLPC